MSKRHREDSEETQGDCPEFGDEMGTRAGADPKRPRRISPFPLNDSGELSGDVGLSEGASEVGDSEDNEQDPWDNETEGDVDEDSWFSGDMLYGRGPGDDSEEEVPDFEEDDFDDGFDDDFEVGLDDEYDEDLMAVFGMSEDGSEDLSETCDRSGNVDPVENSGSPDDLPFDEPECDRKTEDKRRRQ
ncbi:MAG: hypothetical protein Q4C47_04650 [Planctomycetia bacterium]|nr:hypothetical protein [Planctomycetia bacterium]